MYGYLYRCICRAINIGMYMLICIDACVDVCPYESVIRKYGGMWFS